MKNNYKHAGFYLTAAIYILLIGSSCSIRITESAQAKLKSGRFTVLLFPVHVLQDRSYFDMKQTALIVDHLNSAQVAMTYITEDEPSVNNEWMISQAAMFKKSASAFQGYIKNHPVKSDYALLVEYLISPKNGEVSGIHYYLTDQQGNIALAGFVTSHSPFFREIKPAGKDGCLALFKREFDSRLTKFHK